MTTAIGYRVREICISTNERIVTDRYFSDLFTATREWHELVGNNVCSLSPATITRPNIDLVRIETLDEDDDRVVVSVSIKRVKMIISKDTE